MLRMEVENAMITMSSQIKLLRSWLGLNGSKRSVIWKQEIQFQSEEFWRDKVYEIISTETSDVDVPQAMKIFVYCSSVAI